MILEQQEEEETPMDPEETTEEGNTQEYRDEDNTERSEADPLIKKEEAKFEKNKFYIFTDSRETLSSTISLLGKTLQTTKLTTIDKLTLINNIKYINHNLFKFTEYSELKEDLDEIDLILNSNYLLDKLSKRIKNKLLETTLINKLKDFLSKFDTGMENYATYYNEETIKLARDRDPSIVPDITEITCVLFYVYCHGEVVHSRDTCELIHFIPIITMLYKYTAAPLCETFISTSMKDKYISLIIKIIIEQNKEIPYPLLLLLISNYIIKELYNAHYKGLSYEYTNIHPSIFKLHDSRIRAIYNSFTPTIEEYIKDQKPNWIYSYPISNPAMHKKINSFAELISFINTDTPRDEVITDLNPCRISYSVVPEGSIPRDSQPLRDKYYSFENTIETTTSLDIKIFNTFKE
jgi:hypothetical protein